ncbi:MAG: hypothetical protein JF888_07445 [Candidatus Dormibacteraeota bacterium]|uniref:Uncharacterized protein n=1 Tax=Candidatus Dormiibacter inghamiae TaxID=3127013 RepID=A0A934KAL6_9BACT|nr:hypothetical protein [Candidatus Dormibacteraeota bacterium]MBJ7606058.1 hypothetical protein [Candidatus Dormibacteraeota bacterium]
MRPARLKAATTLLTVGFTCLAALYVNAHVKNSAAPLHPAVVNRPSAPASQPESSLNLSPSVKTGDVTPVTSTYAS